MNDNNYIKRLQRENRAQAYALQLVRDEIQQLKVYLSSAKFADDTTVQVRDVLNRLRVVEDATYEDTVHSEG